MDSGSKTYHLVRPPDHLWLTITTVGLTEQDDPSGPQLVADGPQGRLIVEFPPQHIAETVAPAGSSTSQARLAGPSSLHFQVVDNQPIPLSANGILAAMSRLPLTGRTQGDASTLELPWRVLMGLADDARCVHRSAPATSADGVTEMWHTQVLRPDNTSAPVFPRATLPVESPFADQTPLGGFFTKIGEQASQHPDQPMSVDQLTLSGFGAWFSASISWPELDWTHRAAMGRDFHVRVLARGVLFPFGHQAAYVQIVEREFNSDDAPTAALRATRSLVITEPAREYDFAERGFVFQGVELAPLLVPGLDEPVSPSLFWPRRGGSPIMFSVRARAAQDIIEMSLPLLFSAGGQAEQLDSMYAEGPSGAPGGERPSSFVGRFMPIAMNTPTQALDGAVHQVQSLTFGGKSIPGDIGFHPIVTQLEVALPAVRQLLGQAQSLTATLADELLRSRPGVGAPPDVLLKFAPILLNFASARAGVVAAPSMNVDQISRTLGPIVAQLPTDPMALFPASSTLLGIVPLRNLIAEVTGRPTITWSGGEHPTAIMNWAQTLTKSVPPFAPTTSDGAQVSLTVQAKSPDGAAPAGGPPPVITDGKLTNFTLSIPPGAGTLLELGFKELTFHAESGALPRTAFAIATAKLKGSLEFVQTLEQYLPNVGNTAPTIDVSATQIKATFIAAVPSPVSMGAFTLRNLLLKAAITLSYINEPVLVEFAFASREQPFLVSVTGFGGGGYLELAIGAGGSDGGLQRFVGALEFGACAAMDFGVASGEVHVFGGVVFAKQESSIEITGYLRIGGKVRVLGLISVSVELTIAMTYVPNVLKGSAKLVITVDLTFWSTSVEIGTSKEFPGPGPQPQVLRGFVRPDPELVNAGLVAGGLEEGGLSVQDALGPDPQSYPWQTYCLAFAGE